MSCESDYPIPQTFYAALDSSDHLVFEADISQLAINYSILADESTQKIQVYQMFYRQMYIRRWSTIATLLSLAYFPINSSGPDCSACLWKSCPSKNWALPPLV